MSIQISPMGDTQPFFMVRTKAWEWCQFSPQFWEPPNTDINLIIWTTTQSCKFQLKIKSVKTDWELSDRRKPGSRVLDPVALVAFRSDKEVSWAILAWSELRVFCIFHLAKGLLQVIFCESLTVFRVLKNLHSVCTLLWRNDFWVWVLLAAAAAAAAVAAPPPPQMYGVRKASAATEKEIWVILAWETQI